MAIKHAQLAIAELLSLGRFAYMKTLLLVGMLLTVVGCGPRLTEAEVVNIARRTAEEHGKRVDDYLSPKVDWRSGKWWVFFDHKVPSYPCAHFFVHVNDKTKDALYLPGE